MTQYLRRYSGGADQARNQAYQATQSTGDILLQAAWVLADWVVTYIGPLFWLYLAAAFLKATLGG